MDLVTFDLHSTMYLLNLPLPSMLATKGTHLHSTMYLLNQYGSEGSSYISSYLHSTMYLLNREQFKQFRTGWKRIYIPLCIY